MGSYTRGRSELIVGLLVLSSIVALVVLIIVMTGRTVSERRRDLYVSLPAAPGLVKGGVRSCSGVLRWGSERLEFRAGQSRDCGHPGHGSRTLTRNTTARLVPVDIFGRQSLVLDLGLAGAAPLAEGDTICGDAPLGMTTKLDQLTDRAERILGDTTRTLIHSVLSGGGVVTRDLDALLLHADRRWAPARVSSTVFSVPPLSSARILPQPRIPLTCA